MNIEAKPIGDTYRFKDRESDIIEVFSSISGLRIIVATAKEMFGTIFLEIFFEHSRGYRFLDEGDLIAYWESEKFSSPHHIYEITAGGWITGEPLPPGFLCSSQAMEIYREWFIATTNGCITVLSGYEPIIREFKK